MTNVKLKLMFFLLNALLTADIVQARPYSDVNTTDIVIKFTNNNNTFILPVDPNSDTLIVASDEQDQEQTSEEQNKEIDTEVEALVNAEQERDEDLSEKNSKDNVNVLDIPKEDTVVIEKRLNKSSPALEEIIEAEMDRDETLTDILFRPESEFIEDMPRFEFLIAAKINESDATNRTLKDSGYSDNNLGNIDRNSSDVLKKVDYVELVEVVKPSKISENKSAYNLANITGHEVDNDLAPDTILSMFSGFTDLQTLFLACFGTLLPLLAVLFATLLIRANRS